ncbi:MAG TPA: DUF3558 domain-containing protein [Pseudonocardia sp.]
MRGIWKRYAVGAIGGLALLWLTGCGGGAAAPSPAPTASSAAPVGPSLPRRPVELRLDGVDPCTLVTAAQRHQLGVNAGTTNSEDYGGPLKGRMCVWSNLPDSPDNAYTGGAILNHGAEFASGLEPLRMVDGFAATTTGSTGTDPTYYCGMLVDVAPGQALSAAYANDSHNYPGMNHQLACDKAQQLASDMLSTLRASKQR